MYSTSIMTSLLKNIQLSRHQALSLVPGQILLGEVEQILPDQSAIVRFGQMRLHAQQEAALEVGQKSWFQVLPQTKPITLKILPFPHAQQHGASGSIDSLIQYFGLQKTKLNEAIVSFFVQEKLPISRTTLQHIHHIAENVRMPIDELLKSAQVAILRGLPITKESISALRSFLFLPPLQQQVEQIAPLLSQEQQTKLLSHFTQPNEELLAAKPNLQQYFRSTGFEDEKILLDIFKSLQQINTSTELNQQLEERSASLKQTIYQMLQDTHMSPAAKERLEGLLQHITGQQLLFVGDQAQTPIQHILFQIPYLLQGQLQTIYGQLEGKKNRHGKLDAENCWVIIYLELPALGETALDLQIINKQISLTLYNENKHLEWLAELKPTLQEGVEKLGYTLINLTWRGKANKSVAASTLNRKQTPYSLQAFYQGVDIRI